MAKINTLINLCGALCGLGDWLRFTGGQWSVERTQRNVLRRLLRANMTTTWGRAHGYDHITSYEDFTSLPLTEYVDYEDSIARIKIGEHSVVTHNKVTLLLPTSGTTRGSKLIPFTAGLQAEFKRALNVWLVNLLLRCPALFTGKQYWSLSPQTTHPEPAPGQVPVGFADDTSYFGGLQRTLLAHSFALPPLLQSITDPQAHEYLSLLFLLREAELTFIFIWSPTFLIAKLDKARLWHDRLCRDIKEGTIDASAVTSTADRARLTALVRSDALRAAALSKIDLSDRSQWRRIWPRLKLISCWADGASAAYRDELAAIFPHVHIEEKGLLSTEAVISLPWWRGNIKPVAYLSHFFEFREIDTGIVRPLWNIAPGIRYAVVVTTGGGLYRYQMHDIVEVIGFVGRIPCLRFIGRENDVVDLVGEKLSAELVQQFFQQPETPPFAFALVAPTIQRDSPAYTLFVEPCVGAQYDYTAILSSFDRHLQTNFHYRHARTTAQLSRPALFVINADTALASFLAREEAGGKRPGDIKYRSLDGRTDWADAFEGRFITEMGSA
jgi:hypothetical protein